MAMQSSITDQVLALEEEQRKTTECLAGIQRFLSHDTSITRFELVAALRLRAEVIEAEALTDRSIRQMAGQGW